MLPRLFTIYNIIDEVYTPPFFILYQEDYDDHKKLADLVMSSGINELKNSILCKMPFQFLDFGAENPRGGSLG